MDENKRMEALYTLLLEQTRVQRELLELSREKRAAVIKNDIPWLTKTVDEEYRLLSEMKRIEKKCSALMSVFGENRGKPADKLTIRDLIDEARGEMKARLVALHEELGGILASLRRQNNENRELLKTQLEYTETMLSIIGGSDDPLNNFYGMDGRASSAEVGGRSVFDTEI